MLHMALLKRHEPRILIFAYGVLCLLLKSCASTPHSQLHTIIVESNNRCLGILVLTAFVAEIVAVSCEVCALLHLQVHSLVAVT